jgi:hypothetical protein
MILRCRNLSGVPLPVVFDAFPAGRSCIAPLMIRGMGFAAPDRADQFPRVVDNRKDIHRSGLTASIGSARSPALATSEGSSLGNESASGRRASPNSVPWSSTTSHGLGS